MEDARLKMRKGTRSCLECRRRKIRCTFEPGSRTCKECVARSTDCREQVRSKPAEPRPTDSRAELRKRVAQLEKTVEIMSSLGGTAAPSRAASEASVSAASIPGAGAGPSSVAGPAAGPAGAELELRLRRTFSGEPEGEPEDSGAEYDVPEDAPSLALFESAGFSHTGSGTPDDRSASSQRLSSRSTPSRSRTKHPQIRRTLLALLPSREDLSTILSTCNAWWASFRPLGPMYIMPHVRQQPLIQFVFSLLDQESPVVVAMGMLCVGIAAYQLPSDVEQTLHRSNLLCAPCKQLFQQYMSVIESSVLADDDLARSVGGVEILACQMHFHMNLGQPRKSWLVLRKAISIAQLLGLHKKGPLENEVATCAVPETIWPTMCMTDRYLSLMLGLPYAVSHSLIPKDVTELAFVTNVTPETLHYNQSLTHIAGSVIDRNEMPGPPSHELTLEIDRRMEALITSVPPEWWRPPHPDDALHTSPTELHDRMAAHFWHHQIRAFLHLPFLLRHDPGPEFAYSRATCLAAARASLEQYLTLRQNPDTGFSMVRIVDFQGFTAGVLILLGLLGYDRAGSSTMPEYDAALAQHDRDLVARTLAILRLAAREPGNLTAAQALRGLEMLCAARESTQGSEWTGRVVVPYFGTITVSSTPITPSDRGFPAGHGGVEFQPHVSSGPAMQQMRYATNDGDLVQGAAGHLDLQSFENLMMQGHPHIDVNWNGLLAMDLDQDWNELAE